MTSLDWLAWQRGEKSGRPCFELARRALGSDVADTTLDVMSLSPEAVGEFDVVLFLGVLYHMPHPLAALERVASVTRERLVLETHVDMLFSRTPAVAFYPGAELNGDDSNWCGPNERALTAMLREVGFKRVEYVWRRPPLRRLARAVKLRLRAGGRPFRETLPQGRVTVHAWK